MKIRGKKIEGFNIETIVIPRGDNDSIILKAQAIVNYDEFDALCSLPKGRTITRKGGIIEEDTKDVNYRTAMTEYNERRVAYMILKSLEATEDLEWDTVNMADPDSWKNYRVELSASGFSDGEQARIIQGVLTANGLNEAKIDEARKSFLAGQVVA